ncbi:MAG: PEP-CTERM sorting domain-containing protein [Bryobacteraceae bacterium]
MPTQNPVGGNYFGFGASGATGGTLEQTFDTDVGVTYIVTYWLTTQELAGDSLPLQQAYVEARDGSGPGANTLGSQLNLLTQAAGWFQGQSLTFTATTTSTTLRFIDQTDADLVGNAAFMVNWGLDNVAVDVATPEPGTYGMLALGLGALALFRKRRLLH